MKKVLFVAFLAAQCAWAFRDIPLPSIELVGIAIPTEAEIEEQMFALEETLLDLEQGLVESTLDWQDQAVASDFETQTQRWVEVLSHEPRAYLHHNFLSPEEADHIISVAKPNLVKSKVVMGETGNVTLSSARTSSGAWVQRGQDPVIAKIEQRISNWTGAPLENAEPMHVLHYQKEEEYQEHYDIYFDSVNIINGGQRVATVLLYLSDVEEGGETVFPLSTEKPTAEQAKHLSVCGQKGVAAKPRKGDALLFFSVLPDGESVDERSLHASCPVVKGEKWVASKWLRESEWIDAPLSQLDAVKQERELLKLREIQARIAATGDHTTM